MRTKRSSLRVFSLLMIGISSLVLAPPVHALTSVYPTTITSGTGSNFADFTALFPAAPTLFAGTLLSSGFGGVGNPSDTFWQTPSGTIARIQSAAYAGVGAAAGKFAYVYQVDCTGGRVDTPNFTIPIPAGFTLTAGLLPGPATETFWQMSTIAAGTVIGFQTEPAAPAASGEIEPEMAIGRNYADPNIGTVTPGLFNISEFGGAGGLGGGDGDAFLGATLSTVIAASADTGGIFWSTPLLVFISDSAPGFGSVTITGPLTAGESPTVFAVVPGGATITCPGDPSCPEITPVPEPGTLLLLGSGIAGLAAQGWRKRQKTNRAGKATA